ncbi:MAG: carboxypeptidase-like regulatory domain-containing protein, partial [Ignavibacteriales bacterium]
MLTTKHVLLLLIVILTTTSNSIYSQTTGTISGKVIDQSTGEDIIGANILIDETTFGAATDLDGKYSIKNIPSGNYSLTISYISYSKKRIENVTVKQNEIIQVDVALQPEAISVDSVVIVGEASLEYEAALLNQQKKSITISDGISREQIKKSPDYTSAEFLQRVPSITLLEGKYIFIRGVSERYSSAQLNNTPLASSEPDKKDFAFDLIPSYLVENTIVEKSYTPDNPGDFAGGIVKINTIDFPSHTLFRFSYGTSYIPNVTTKNFNTYAGGSKDYLGIDDGTRDLPEGFPSDIRNLVPNDDSVYNLAQTLKNNWQVNGSRAPINQAFSLAYGDKFDVFGQDFGLISSFNYKTEHTENDLITRQVSGGDEYVFDYQGRGYNHNVNWGILLNLNYKFSDFHKLGLKNTYTTNSDDDVIELNGIQYDRSNEQNLTALRFVSRELYSGQVVGQSYFSILSGLQADYSVSYSESFRNEPDFRRYTYGRDMGSPPEEPFRILTSLLPNLREGGRFYSDLNEISRGYKLDLNWQLGPLKTKFGGLYDNRSRSFNSRIISMISQQTTNSSFYYYQIDSVFASENFRQSGWSMGEYNDGTSDYNSSDENVGLYGLFEYPFSLLNQNFNL